MEKGAPAVFNGSWPDELKWAVVQPAVGSARVVFTRDVFIFISSGYIKGYGDWKKRVARQ